MFLKYPKAGRIIKKSCDFRRNYNFSYSSQPHEMKRLPLADYDTKQLEDFSRYVFVMSEVGLRQKDMAKQLDVSR
ncbi:hypothetical protein DW220_00435 [Eubacterium sp. AM18-26]|nr:hypothetical protein DW220_00435 [Eubacterium sp. AM18-26]RHO28816.1 hypothetical protein DW212_00315 [Eubacterium sp. AM18-10LB-B]